MIIDSIGNVGIGVAGSSYKLDVFGMFRMKDHLVFNSNNAVINWGASDLYFRTNPVTGDHNNYSDKMIIKNNGNVGIGTTTLSAGEKLAVSNGTTQLGIYPGYVDLTPQLGWTSLRGTNIRIGDNLSIAGLVDVGTTLSVTGLSTLYGGMSFIAAGSRHLEVTYPVGGNINDPFIFNTSNSILFTTDANSVKSLFLNPDGNVSIGTTTAANGYKLTVAGSIICTELKVQLQPFPDYVFAKDYNLKSIEEVEQHINTYNRLPGMPSACEVEEGGMSVGEMTGKVVEKVEENTLYIIQLKKEIDALKAELNALKK